MLSSKADVLARPLYQQVFEDIKSQITSGNYAAGDRLPSEADLMQHYGVSRITIRRAVSDLCDNGYLVKRQGIGTFIEKPRIRRTISSVRSFSESCAEMNITPRYQVNRLLLVKPRADEMQFLQIGPDDLLIYSNRILSADDTPIIQENCFYPYDDRFKWLMQESLAQPLYPLMFKHGIHPTSAEKHTIEIATASDKMAEAMRMSKGGPMFYRTAYLLDDQKKPLYIERSYIVGSRYIFEFTCDEHERSMSSPILIKTALHS